YPLAAVGGSAQLMRHVSETWISSTMATEFVSIAAALATLEVIRAERLSDHLGRVGGRLLVGLEDLARRFPALVTGAAGIPELCYLRFANESVSQRVARGCAHRGLLFKRTAYNFVSLAHDEAAVDSGLGLLAQALAE